METKGTIKQYTIWKQLRRNKFAMAGLICIVLCFFIAVFAYWLAPDSSTNADLQCVEIQAKPPGFTQQFLKIPLNSQVPSTHFLMQWWNGHAPTYKLVPIVGYSVKPDSIVVQQYIDETLSMPKTYPLSAFSSSNIETYIVTKTFYLGTDKFGRDILSRLLIGTRVSLSVGFVAVLISVLLGVFLGAIAGYYRGRLDAIIVWLINVTWSIPTLLLVFALTMAMGKGLLQIFIAIGLTMWVGVARLVRGQVLAIRTQEYVLAARALGYKDSRIIWRHILPNITGPLLVVAAGNFATAIIIEAGLSFLGIGVQAPQPSWGLMIKENYQFIITNNPMLAIVPGLAIMLLVLSFNLLGNGLRDATDVKNDL
ncbi:MAG: ABC transporter permease [Ferruginibacter sp.]